MTGLEKIINRINADTEKECSSIAAAAEKTAEGIIEKAKAAGQELASRIEADAEKNAAGIVSIAESGASQRSRQRILAAKVELINDTLAGALEALRNLPADEYFACVIKLAAENAFEGKCTAKLSAADLKRVPSGFAGELKSALAAKGAECTLSDAPANIGSGVFLDYGDIAVNCSFEAVIEDRADDCKALISGILFDGR